MAGQHQYWQTHSPQAVSPAGHRPWIAHRRDAGNARAEGREESAHRQRRADGPGPVVAGVHEGADAAPRGRTSKGRTGEHGLQDAQPDEEAGTRQFRVVRSGVQKELRRSEEAAVSGALFHLRASGLRSRRDDRAGSVPQAERLPARAGAGFHPGAVRRGRLHVPHRAGPDDHETGARRQTPPRSQASTGPDAVLRTGQLLPGAKGLDPGKKMLDQNHPHKTKRLLNI